MVLQYIYASAPVGIHCNGQFCSSSCFPKRDTREVWQLMMVQPHSELKWLTDVMKTKLSSYWNFVPWQWLCKECSSKHEETCGIGGTTFFDGHPRLDWIKAYWKTVPLSKILSIIWLGHYVFGKQANCLYTNAPFQQLVPRVLSVKPIYGGSGSRYQKRQVYPAWLK